MPRYFIDIAFRGEPFHGWQIQPGDTTVQQTVEEAMGRYFRRPTSVTGAGRTDAGVNARRMVAHFDTPEPIADSGSLLRALNAMCGRDIALSNLRQVADDAHARFDATSRTYHYYATLHKSPFFHSLSWQAPPRLDFEAMNRAAWLLLTTSDFASFAKLHSDAKTTICRVTEAEWRPCGCDGMVFVFTADRFLRNMVRAVVGTLVDVGRGKLTADGFAEIIARRDRCAAGTSMPPQALYLWDITYPFE